MIWWWFLSGFLTSLVLIFYLKYFCNSITRIEVLVAILLFTIFGYVITVLMFIFSILNIMIFLCEKIVKTHKWPKFLKWWNQQL